MAGPSAAGLGVEGDAGGADVVGVEPADLVVLDLADIGAHGRRSWRRRRWCWRPSRRTSRSPGPCRDRSRRRGPRRSAPCRPWSCRGGRESPRRSAPARRKSHCRSRERRILRQPFITILLRQLRWRESVRPAEGAAAYHDGPAPASDGCYRSPMIRSFLTVSSGTLASRLLGFVRDSMIAALLGAGAGRGRVPGGVSARQCRHGGC